MYSCTLSSTSALDEGRWSTPRSGRFTPRERPGTHCIGGWVDPRAGLDVCGKARPPPGFDPRTVQPVASRYTDWAIPALCYDTRCHWKIPVARTFGAGTVTVMEVINCFCKGSSRWFIYPRYPHSINAFHVSVYQNCTVFGGEIPKDFSRLQQHETSEC